MRIRHLLWVLAAAGVIVAGFLPVFPAKKSGPTDYQRELQKVDADLAALPRKYPAEPDRTLHRAGLLYTRASLTSDFGDFKLAEHAIDEAFARAGAIPDLVLLRAQFRFKLHQLREAESDLAVLDPEMRGVAALRADLAFQRGDYAGARRGYDAAIAADGHWDDTARLAYLQSRMGDVAGAMAAYTKAEDSISVKEMRSFAWIELQLGLVEFERRNYDDALVHYRRADRAYSGYWLVEEHIAEALAASGKTPEAVALYEKVIRDTHNPEYLNALGRIVERTDPAAAAKLYAEADRRNAERFALYPDAAIGHLIRDALLRREARPDLVSLAERNYALRPNGEAALLLARAYLKANQRTEAHAVMNRLEATPWRTPEVAAVRAGMF
jgi:tetratricopeptide (TPR) repeat protein